MGAVNLHHHDSKANNAVLSVLDDTRLFRQLAYINSKWVAGNKDTAVVNPADDKVLGYVTDLKKSQIDNAVNAANRAFPAWRALSAEQRAERLMAWNDLILENKEDLSKLMVLEQGKTLNEARGEIDYGASFIRWFAEEARRAYGETMPSHIPNAQLATLREPIGVAALITPWNFPNAMITRKAAAALAIGCTVIVKPANETPFSALALAELAERAGIPAGVFNVVTGDPEMISAVLCNADAVKALSFTGSTRVGKILLEQCASTVKKCSMELGGNAPFIVLPDMDIKEAAKAAVDAKFQTSGQDCLAANRIFIPRDKYAEFTDAFANEMQSLTVGNGMNATTDIGPLINRKAVEKAQMLVDDALEKGATMIAGSQKKASGKNFFHPVMLTNVTPDMAVYREENFCPVAGVLPYDNLDDLLIAANDTEYGLAAYVYGHDIRDIWKLMRGLEFGMVSVNSVKMTGHPIPFGGMKQSGLGREGSRHGFDEYSEIKYYCLGGLDTASGC
ncbi:NAD-dependent succinate-semialdehyde dehydrogenase [Enterovibrio norvegicus]|uniref:NAD-dependent succinate-semialdehyde dehydrogenase n=1 Tax=Enterovibrio norvegicus TaxID=188144 RepID=UPI000C83148E|nr:NAD-dependent succinate-semialdehyde dehydrogenase [Enterovibrio norvegicus]MCC4799398.1 NAD-dependent succinate-semialdehyde dehydrogenase [Enterovibrio norvegicus]PMH69752.1 NAD-dependent succinate-semialdehyde dehydrogenase [Enterovibrio norvegicus]PMI31846.1 NAD-dependent succinate-semialdehyde dehydrogenase [Enterovibrio norvegicus]PMI34193.1 NAD-dependent succinate-semialdehyde dehydrogenase [Enterovibrio norvegicus]PMN54978.1 NAD-dependent succinate-semialdehyde dehydrogenase [Entero